MRASPGSWLSILCLGQIQNRSLGNIWAFWLWSRIVLASSCCRLPLIVFLSAPLIFQDAVWSPVFGISWESTGVRDHFKVLSTKEKIFKKKYYQQGKYQSGEAWRKGRRWCLGEDPWTPLYGVNGRRTESECSLVVGYISLGETSLSQPCFWLAPWAQSFDCCCRNSEQLWFKEESSSFSLSAWGCCGSPMVSVSHFLPCYSFIARATSLSGWLKIVYHCVHTSAKWGQVNGEQQAKPFVSSSWPRICRCHFYSQPLTCICQALWSQALWIRNIGFLPPA